MRFSEKVHLENPNNRNFTICGKLINGITLRYAFIPKSENVTCKHCLAFFSKHHICTRCGHVDKIKL